MNWTERLNQVPGRVPLGFGADAVSVDIRHWAYARHLPDNVPHRHTYFEVCLVGAHGSGEFRVERTALPILPGDIFIARPGVIHQIVNTSEPKLELFWVAFSFADPLKASAELAAFTGASDVLVAQDIGGRLLGLWQALRTAADAAPDGGDISLILLMASLVLEIASAGSTHSSDEFSGFEGVKSGPASIIVQQALSYIHEHIGRPSVTLADIASAVNVSPRHLTRAFTAFTGNAPAAYIAKARLDRARTLLLRTDDPIKQIAALVGYKDIHHFTRSFSRRFGCPPGRFRATRGAADTSPHGNAIPIPGMLV